MSSNITLRDIGMDRVFNNGVHMEFTKSVDMENITVFNGQGMYNIYGHYVEHINLRDSELSGGSRGIYFRFYESNNITIENVFIHDFRAYGIYLDSATSRGDKIADVVIKKNTIINDGYDGIWLSGVVNTDVTENNIRGSGYNGIRTLNFDENVNISDNKIEGMHTGIRVTSTLYSLIEHNMVYNSSNYGIELTNAKYNKVIENVINNTSIYGLYLGLTSNNNIITGNKICNSTSYGIYI
jgi:parallel beta-helix repeat protein